MASRRSIRLAIFTVALLATVPGCKSIQGHVWSNGTNLGCYSAFIEHSDANEPVSGGAKTWISGNAADCTGVGQPVNIAVSYKIQCWCGETWVNRATGSASGTPDTSVQVGAEIAALWAWHRTGSNHDITGTGTHWLYTDWE
jgi:hypothetical protein